MITKPGRLMNEAK